MREADVDGNAAALFLFQAVGVNAGQGLDQRGFAVIDVPRGTDNDRLHCRTVYSMLVATCLYPALPRNATIEVSPLI